jgi:hypothetical protein
MELPPREMLEAKLYEAIRLARGQVREPEVRGEERRDEGFGIKAEVS